MKTLSLALIALFSGGLLQATIVHAQDGACSNNVTKAPNCAQSSKSILPASRDFTHNTIYTVGSSIGIGTSDKESKTITVTPAIPTVISATGQVSGSASASLTGPGNVASGAYTENIAQTHIHSLYLGQQATIRTNSVSTTNNVSWATAVSTGNGSATVSATGQSQSAAFAQSGMGNNRVYAGTTAASQGAAMAALSGPGIAQAKNSTWTTITTTTNATYNSANLTQATASSLSRTGSTSIASATSTGTGNVSAQASAASSAQAIAAIGNATLSSNRTAGSVTSGVAAPSGSAAAVASTQQAASAIARLISKPSSQLVNIHK